MSATMWHVNTFLLLLCIRMNKYEKSVRSNLRLKKHAKFVLNKGKTPPRQLDVQIKVAQAHPTKPIPMIYISINRNLEAQ